MTLKAQFRIKYPRFQLDVRIDLDEGQTLGIWGPSGSGKTSILRVLAGFNLPFGGEISFRRLPWLSTEQKVNLVPEKRQIGYMLQDPFLFSNYDVKGNLLFGQRQRENHNHISFDEVVEALDLVSILDRHPRDLSGGEKQRVSMGRAILSQPDLLLLDEPFASLDPVRRQHLVEFIYDLPMSKVIVSHDPYEIETLTSETLTLQGQTTHQQHTEQAWQNLYEEGDAFSLHNLIVEEVDPGDELCRAREGSTSFLLPLGQRRIGDRVQVKFRARDISIGLHPIKDSSILNCIPVQVEDVVEARPGMVLVRMSMEPIPALNKGRDRFLYAHITRRSRRTLNLQPGDRVHAFIKGMAILTQTKQKQQTEVLQ